MELSRTSKVCLSDITVVEARMGKRIPPGEFEIVTNTKSCRLRAASAAEMREWMQTLSSATLVNALARTLDEGGRNGASAPRNCA